MPLIRRVSPRGWGWDLAMAIAMMLLGLALIRIWYPGQANVDIAHQARQALGQIPYDDWHPPVMSALWELLLATTGRIGSLLVVQIGLYVLGGFLLARLIRIRTRSRGRSLLAIVLLLLPWSISQIGMLWKDSQMAVALLVAVLMLAMIRPSRVASWWWLLPAMALLTYGIAVRKNAVFALLPIAIHLGWLVMATLRCHHRAAAAILQRARARAVAVLLATMLAFGVVGAAVVVVGASVDVAKSVQPTSQISQIYLDDVMFSVPDAELRSSGAPPELIEHISTSREACLKNDTLWDAYWRCYGKGATGKPFSPIAYQPELRELWLQHVITHPGRYLAYRTVPYSHYLFSSQLAYWPTAWNVEATSVGLGSKGDLSTYTMAAYVDGIAQGSLSMTFQPWFWLLAAIGCLVLARRSPRFAGPIAVLAGSALAYMLGYFPVIPANHFRYTYWPALAVSAAALLLLAARGRRQLPDDPVSYRGRPVPPPARRARLADEAA